MCWARYWPSVETASTGHWWSEGHRSQGESNAGCPTFRSGAGFPASACHSDDPWWPSDELESKGSLPLFEFCCCGKEKIVASPFQPGHPAGYSVFPLPVHFCLSILIYTPVNVSILSPRGHITCLLRVHCLLYGHMKRKKTEDPAAATHSAWKLAEIWSHSRKTDISAVPPQDEHHLVCLQTLCQGLF